ncbi:MAG: hypothetical protein NHB32_14695 [Fischerella sp. CENA71]|nr:hypothetical protein [Fischerella sp. CENA71]
MQTKQFSLIAVRTRTTISHAQTGEWLGTYGGAGNGEVKEDLERSHHANF